MESSDSEDDEDVPGSAHLDSAVQTQTQDSSQE